ncbi:MAG: ATP-grasp domain-containing protein [Actinomycetota bacterium]
MVIAIDPNEARAAGTPSWTEGIDMVLARGRSEQLLACLAVAEALGVATLNTSVAIRSVRDKRSMTRVLEAGKIPTPATYLAPIRRLVHMIRLADYPIILKPIFGDNARGLRIVRTPADLAKLAWSEPVALAQSFLPSDGYDLKLYGIGSRVWAVRKRSPLLTVTGGRERIVGGEPVPLTPELEALARRCASAFDLDLYGVDCLPTDRGPVVLEVNDFPNYSGVPDASDRLATYVAARARERGM